jgi:hypothetical protein
MRKIGLAAFAITIGLTIPSGNAQVGGPSNDTFKAEYLHTACNPPPGADQATRDSFQMTCDAYLRGLTDGLFLMKQFHDKGGAGCLPENTPISIVEAKADFELFLSEHPEASQNSAGIVVGFGIMRAHPCQGSN